MATRKKHPTARDKRSAARKDGSPEALKKAYVPPIPESMKGPSKGKNGNGRPRTGNKAIDFLKDGSEIGSSHAHLVHAYNRFLEGIDEKDLHSALALDPRRKMQICLAALTHPGIVSATRRGSGKPGEWSIAAILKRQGLTLIELMDTYGRYRTSQAIRVAMDRSPKIMTHTADDAENRMVVCSRCDGFGTLDIDREEESVKRQKALLRTCPECKGTGEVNQSGDSEARKLIFEVAGIAGKKGPMVDARQIHIGQAGGFSVENSVKEMEGWADEDQPKLTSGTSGGNSDSEILDAEVVDE